jgi:hypothetical protein
MSLTYHQTNNSSTWKAIDSLINHDKVVHTVHQINQVCQSRNIYKLHHYPQDYNFPLLGKSVIYAYIFSKFPEHYVKTLVGRSNYNFSFVENINDIAKRSIAAAYCESLIREGKSSVTRFLSAGTKALNGTLHSSSFDWVYKDLSLLIDSMPILEDSPSQIDFNVPPRNAFIVGGADVQMKLGRTVWSFHTGLKRQPLTVDKLKQQLAYFLLEYDFEEGDTSWQKMGFYFPRHSNFVVIEPESFLLLSSGRNLSSFKNMLVLEG